MLHAYVIVLSTVVELFDVESQTTVVHQFFGTVLTVQTIERLLRYKGVMLTDFVCYKLIACCRTVLVTDQLYIYDDLFLSLIG